MEQRAPGASPVLHYLAVVRAARDFGLNGDEIDRLAAGFAPVPDAVEAFAQAVADTLLARG
jgi:hypothetical protein